MTKLEISCMSGFIFFYDQGIYVYENPLVIYTIKEIKERELVKSKNR